MLRLAALRFFNFVFLRLWIPCSRSGMLGPAAVTPHAREGVEPCYAGVSSDRTNLSPFTKDYRGLALQCD